MSEVMVVSNVILKGLLSDAIVYRGELTQEDDLNNVIVAGIYDCNLCINLPTAVNRYGSLRVSYVKTRILHEFFPDAATGAVLARSTPIWRERIGSNWAPWRLYSGEIVST